MLIPGLRQEQLGAEHVRLLAIRVVDEGGVLVVMKVIGLV